MAFTPDRFGADLARILNALQALRTDEIAQIRSPDPLSIPFAKPKVGTLVEADLLTLHFYHNSFALCIPLHHNTHGIADAMKGTDISGVRAMLKEIVE